MTARVRVVDDADGPALHRGTIVMRAWNELRDALTRLDDEARRAAPDPAADRKLVLLTVTGAVMVVLLSTVGTKRSSAVLIPLLELFVDDGRALWRAFFETHARAEYHRLVYWLCSIQLSYFVIPALVARLVAPRTPLASLGLGTAGALRHWRVYATLFAAVVVPLVVAATTTGFGRYYPMYAPARTDVTELVRWELVYLPQFFAVEFFFRGVLLFPFARRFGALAVLFPILPYALIHVGKPLPEALGAIVAGLVLGALALASRTIWLGVALHVAVALTMDVVAGFFGARG